MHLKSMSGAAHCHMCARCSGHKGAIALAMGAGTPFLNSRAAYAAAADLAKQELRTIGLSVTVQERILADFKKRSERIEKLRETGTL